MRAIDLGLPGPPLPDGLLAALAGATPGNLCDALGAGAPDAGGGALPPAIRPVTPRAGFAGRALTVALPPGDHLALWAAIAVARPGDVLVAATGGCLTRAILGDLMAGLAVNAGVVALVTDGALRDAEGIAARGLVAFAAGLCPTPPTRDGGGAVGRAVCLGGVTIHSGDLLVGNGDGVALLPRAAFDRVAAALGGVRAREATIEALIADRGRLPPALRERLAACGVELPPG